MANIGTHYIHALRFHWLTPPYDPLLKWGMREDNGKRRLIEDANIQPGQRVLDLGFGTGTLALMLKQSIPEPGGTGLDADEQVLAIAKTKAERATNIFGPVWFYEAHKEKEEPK